MIQLNMSRSANEKSQQPENDTEATFEKKSLTWSDKLPDFFHTVRSYPTTYVATEWGLEWNAEEKEDSMKEAGQDTSQGKE